MLPDDEINRVERLNRYAKEFLFAQQVVDIGVHAVEVFAETGPTSTFSEGVSIIVGGLLVRGLRQLRAIVALAELGLVDNMEVLARSLFENHVAVRYILNGPRPPSRCSGDLKVALARLPKIPKSVRAVDFRSALYGSYWLINHDKKARNATATHRLKRTLSKRARDRLGADADKAKQAIGPDWVKAQKAAGTYSGLHIAQLAEYCGLKFVHSATYGFLCLKSHANNALDYFSETDGLLVAADEGNLVTVMEMAEEFFLVIVADINRSFGLGLPIAFNRGKITIDPSKLKLH